MSSSVTDTNLLAKFLAHPQVPSISESEAVDCIVICASAVLQQATVLFRTLESRPDLTRTLVLCGGIGHSTSFIYNSISQHPVYHNLANDVEGMPEARVLELILTTHFNVEKITNRGCQILVEDQSTNCGANAAKTRELLEKEGVPAPKTMYLVQDPTMALRTVATFEKAFENEIVEVGYLVKSAPVLVPRVKNDGGKMAWDVEGAAAHELWEIGRFQDLIIGEIPRLRDDENGYGPSGKGFIVHVDIPAEVEEAWRRLKEEFGGSR